MSDAKKQHDDEFAIGLVGAHLSGEAADALRQKLEDAHRFAVIRDAFLEGRDRDAVTLIRQLSDRAVKDEGEFALLPMSSWEAGSTFHPGQRATLTARPQVEAFRGVTLLVGQASSGMLITDIRVGNRTMFAQAGSIPADVFSRSSEEAIIALPRGDDPLRPELHDRDISRLARVYIEASTLARMVPLGMEICQAGMDITLDLYNPTVSALPWHAVLVGKRVPSTTFHFGGNLHR